MAVDGAPQQESLLTLKLAIWWPSLMALAVLANSAVLLYGFRKLHELSASVRVAFTTIALGAGELAQRPGASPTATTASQVRVEIYSDFECRFCRASVPAVDSARSTFRDSVTWVYRYLPNVASELSLLSAFAGACVSDGTGPWRLYSEIRGEDWSRKTLEHGLRKTGADLRALGPCISADSTQQRVWLDVFRAFAVGINRTPTVVVDGLVLSGQTHYEPLAGVIRDRMRRRRTATP